LLILRKDDVKLAKPYYKEKPYCKQEEEEEERSEYEMKKGPKSYILRKIALNLPMHISRYLLTFLGSWISGPHLSQAFNFQG